MAKEKYPSELAERFQIRMPNGLRDRIRAASEASGRSMNAEIVHRLEASFLGPSTLGEAERLQAMHLAVIEFTEEHKADYARLKAENASMHKFFDEGRALIKKATSNARSSIVMLLKFAKLAIEQASLLDDARDELPQPIAASADIMRELGTETLGRLSVMLGLDPTDDEAFEELYAAVRREYQTPEPNASNDD